VFINEWNKRLTEQTLKRRGIKRLTEENRLNTIGTKLKRDGRGTGILQLGTRRDRTVRLFVGGSKSKKVGENQRIRGGKGGSRILTPAGTLGTPGNHAKKDHNG